MPWVAWLGLGVLYNPIGPIHCIVTVAEKHRGSQDRRTAFSYISRIIISQQFRYFLTCLYFQCYRIKMSAQTKVEVTRGVFDPRTYKQVKMDYNFSWQKGTNFFLMGNCVKSLSSCGGGENLEQYENLHKLIILNEQCLKYQSGIWSIQNITLWIRKWQRLKCLWKMKQLVRDCSDFVFLAWPKYWWKIRSTLIVKLHDSFWNNRNAFWIFIAHILRGLCSRDWK